MESEYVSRAREYCERVISGVQPVAKITRLSIDRQIRDLQRADTDLEFPWVFDKQKAHRVCEFIELLRHTKGAWARKKLTITLEGWQCFFLTCAFGWVHRETGMRRFREVQLIVPRKNAKSTIAAGIALYMTSADGEPGAEVYTAATTGKQARIVFDDAKAMASRDAEMRYHLGIEVMMHQLMVPDTLSKLEPLHAEGSTLDGLNVHCVVIDEFHAHKRRDLYDVLITAMGSREQPMALLITTAGSDRAGICYERQTHLQKVLNQTFEDDSVFGVIYTIDADDDPFSEIAWQKANPNYGISVRPEILEIDARQAQSMPSALSNFLTKRLNVWVNADSAWMDMQAWDACADPAMRIEDFEGDECIESLDLAERKDITAKIRIFTRDDHVYVFGDYWLPELAIETSTNSQYQGWARRGLLRVSEGEVTDFREVEDALRDDAKRFAIRECAFDPWHARQLAGHMIEEGVVMVEVPATLKHLSEPMKYLEELVLKRRLHHNGDPILTWMVSNVVAHRDTNDCIRPNKERPENKIDGVVALIMGLNRVMFYEGAAGSIEQGYVTL